MPITAKKRKSLKKSQFGVPSKAKGKAKGKPGNYPIDTLARARAALRLVAQHGTPAEKASVRSRVYKKYPQLRPKKK